MGQLGVAVTVVAFTAYFVQSIISALKGNSVCTPITGTIDGDGVTVSANALSINVKVLTVTQGQISALGKRDANPDAELSGLGHISLAPRVETLDSRTVTAKSVYYSFAASGRNSCSTTMSVSDIQTLINHHIGPMMPATGATCGVFTIDNSGIYSIDLEVSLLRRSLLLWSLLEPLRIAYRSACRHQESVKSLLADTLDAGFSYGGNAASSLCPALTISCPQSVLLEFACSSIFRISTVRICFRDFRSISSEREDEEAPHSLTAIISCYQVLKLHVYSAGSTRELRIGKIWIGLGGESPLLHQSTYGISY